MRYSKRDSVDTFKAVTRTTIDYKKGTKNKDIFFTQDERFLSNKGFDTRDAAEKAKTQRIDREIKKREYRWISGEEE